MLNLRSLILVLLEVLREQCAELLNLALEVGSAVPALGWVEQLVGNVGAGLGDRQVEGLVDLVLDVGELARVDGVEDGAGVLEGAALACRLSVGFFEVNVKGRNIPPVVAPAPTQPVLRSQALAPCSWIFSASILA